MLALIFESKILVTNFEELLSCYLDRGGFLLNPPYRSEKTLEICILALKTLGAPFLLFSLLIENSCDLTTRSYVAVSRAGFALSPDLTIFSLSCYRRGLLVSFRCYDTPCVATSEDESFCLRSYDNVFVVTS